MGHTLLTGIDSGRYYNWCDYLEMSEMYNKKRELKRLVVDMKSLGVRVSLSFVLFSILNAMSFAADINEIDRTANDGQLNLYLRAVSINTKIENELIEDNFGGFPFGNDLGGTALGAVLDYDSLYWNDTIGAAASLYGVAKVDSEQYSRDLFDDTDGSNKGFGKVGQAYIKLKRGGEDWFVGFQTGLGRFDAGTLVTSDTRAVPGSYRGARFNYGLSGLDIGPLPGTLMFDAAYIDRASPRDRAKTEHIRSEAGETIEHLYTFGVKYDLKALELSYATGVSKDFNRNTKYGIELKAPLGDRAGVILDTQYYDFREAGDIWAHDLNAGVAAYESSANWLNVNLGMLIDNWRFGLSWTKSEAELGNGQIGYAYFDHANNVDGRSDVWTRSGNDFNSDGEKAWQVGMEYRFMGHSIFDVPLDGVRMMALYKWGGFDATNPLTGQEKDVKERQYEYRLYYMFEDPDYTGLSVGVIYTDYDINEEFVSLVSAQPDNVVTGRELRVYLDYAF